MEQSTQGSAETFSLQGPSSDLSEYLGRGEWGGLHLEFCLEKQELTDNRVFLQEIERCTESS